MLIDVHVHAAKAITPFARPGGTRYPTPEELIAQMDRSGIDKAAVMCVPSPECRYMPVLPHDVMGICQEHPDRLIPFFNLDPRYLKNDATSDFRPMLKFYKEAGFKGVGEFIPNIAFDDPRNINLFRQIEEFDLPLTFHIAPKIGGHYGVYDELGLPRLENVLKACPRLKFFGHSQPFWAEIGTDVNENNRYTYPKGKVTPGRLVELMRNYPNLHGDLSAGSGHNAISRDPEFGCAFMEEFQDRLMFGTDIANYPPEELPIVAYFRKLKAGRLISPEAYEKIAWRNANRILGLGLGG